MLCWCLMGNDSGPIGEAQLAARGYNILLVARSKDNLKRAAKEIRRTSRQASGGSMPIALALPFSWLRMIFII